MTTGTGSKEKWTPFADGVIEALYAKKGARACQSLLPGRSIMAIRQRAHKLRVLMNEWPVPPKEGELYPRDEVEAVCDAALRCFRACEPAANLCYSVGVICEVA